MQVKSTATTFLLIQDLSHHLVHQDQAAGYMEGTLEGGTLAGGQSGIKIY